MIDFITTTNFATLLGVSVSTIDKWVVKGKYFYEYDENGNKGFRYSQIKDIPIIKEIQNSLWDTETNIIPKRKYTTIELFAGAGGLALGLEKAGFHHILLNEYEHNACETLKTNRPNWNVIEGDIHNVSFIEYKDNVDLLSGGFPCQAFSYAGNKAGFEDARGTLFFEMARAIQEINPKVVLGENVKGLISHDNGKTISVIKNVIKELGYKLIEPRILKSILYKVPQKRERLVIIGTTIPGLWFEKLWLETQADIAEEIPDYFTAVTVRDAIGNLPAVTPDGIIQNPAPETAYQRYLASVGKTITNHTKSNHSAKAVDRMRQIGSGKNYTELDEEINSVHSGSYGRLCWDEPATTITTRFDTPAGGRFIHPIENRTLSPREAARIQSFPDDFEFFGTKREISRQIGNAVPPKVSYFLARFIIKILEQEKVQ